MASVDELAAVAPVQSDADRHTAGASLAGLCWGRLSLSDVVPFRCYRTPGCGEADISRPALEWLHVEVPAEKLASEARGCCDSSAKADANCPIRSLLLV
ncbi:hypothetical protein GCM10011509_29890 [Ornithinimicrobium pekingense]|uniref:Uncharacterized protein n=1 Tax=Ornithinimicrobium pekingense TaxID=384677 RepID=A0ABQ2FBW1_9MICO|nr:hypothetical protein GCM10011509_29890 [Ornithinimicrobium pekingense]